MRCVIRVGGVSFCTIALCWIRNYTPTWSVSRLSFNLQFDTQDKIESSRKRTRSLSELTLNSETSIDLSEYWLLTGKGKTWQLRISTCPCKRLEQNINWHFVLKYPEIYIVHYCMKNVYSLYIIIVFDRCVKVFCIKGLRMRYTLFRKLKNKNPIFLIF